MRFRLKQKDHLYLIRGWKHWLRDFFKFQLSHLFNGGNNNHRFSITIVIVTNSMPTVIPNLDCGKEGNFIQCNTIVVQHGCENSMVVEQLNSAVAQLWSNRVVKWPWREVALGRGDSALVYSTFLALPAMLCSSPFHSDLARLIWCFSSRWGNTFFSPW